MISMDEIEKLEDKLQEFWGDLHKKTFAQNSKDLLDDEALLAQVCASVEVLMLAGMPDSQMAMGSILIAMAKRAYELGRRSMIQ